MLCILLVPLLCWTPYIFWVLLIPLHVTPHKYQVPFCFVPFLWHFVLSGIALSLFMWHLEVSGTILFISTFLFALHLVHSGTDCSLHPPDILTVNWGNACTFLALMCLAIFIDSEIFFHCRNDASHALQHICVNKFQICLCLVVARLQWRHRSNVYRSVGSP